MELPANVALNQVSPTMVEVRGWASEPFVMTEASARKSLERVRSRRASYSSPDEYEKHLSVYVEAFRLMGWEVPEDRNAPVPPPAVVEPTPPLAAPAEQPGPSGDPNSAAQGPQAAPQMEFDLSFREPPVPGPARMDGPVKGPDKTWVEQMLEDKTSS